MDAEGRPLATTRKYSPDVGKVFATVEGLTSSYKLTGHELYIRAVVTSDQPHVNPSLPNQLQHAWTQPVGWREIVQQPVQAPSEK